jgi:hypothetical protein
MKASPGNYTKENQCTSSAINLANQCGINVPNGISPVKASGLSDNLPNPYGLQQQLNNTMAPVSVPALNFPDGVGGM